MPNYTEFMMRHGECGIQDIVERLERYEGVRSNVAVPLEQRWNALMQPTQDNIPAARVEHKKAA